MFLKTEYFFAYCVLCSSSGMLFLCEILSPRKNAIHSIKMADDQKETVPFKWAI